MLDAGFRKNIFYQTGIFSIRTLASIVLLRCAGTPLRRHSINLMQWSAMPVQAIGLNVLPDVFGFASVQTATAGRVQNISA